VFADLLEQGGEDLSDSAFPEDGGILAGLDRAVAPTGRA